MKTLIYLNFAIISISFLSCDDFLDENPQNKITPTSIAELSYVIGPVREITGLNSLSIILSDNFKVTESKYTGSMIETQPWVESAVVWADYLYPTAHGDQNWDRLYRCIYYSNYVLDALNEINFNSGEQEEFDRVKGEAHGLRALSYFHLINDYAKHYDANTSSTDPGVPINNSVDLEQLLPRSTVAEVYDLIISDLGESIKLLPEMAQPFPKVNYAPGKASAYALLARVRLMTGEWELATEAAKSSLSIHNFLYDYTLGPPIPDERNEDFEVIWDRKNVISNGTINSSSTTLRAAITDDVFQLYDTISDLRWRYYFAVENDKIVYLRGEQSALLPISQSFGITVPEVYLTLAEAYARLDNIIEATDVMHKLQQMRYDPATFVPIIPGNKDEALQIILAERRKELLFLGLRWWDQKRLIQLGEYNKTITRTYDGKTVSLEPSSPRYVLPIPRMNISRNPNLIQNPR